MTVTYATGGIVRLGADLPPLILERGCDYIIPWPVIERMKKMREDLDRLNEEG